MLRKITAFILALSLILVYPFFASAVSIEKGTDELIKEFNSGKGPAIGDYSIDYEYYSPVKENDGEKYPLVIWLHGMGDGSEPAKQIKKSNISYWTSDEFQARFKSADGAFILAARSLEEDNIYWSNDLLKPLKAAIDDFIAKNKDNIDLSRIYVGGYSMGGKMTYKMAIAYPEMFAAAFPICPAWSPSDELLEKIADMPIWLTSSTRDPLVNYFMAVTPTWERLTNISNVPEKCRFSTLTKVCFEDGKKTDSSHHAWFAVNHDMFTNLNGDYHNMTTVNGLGEKITLTYPDGMISWLSSHTSNYDGTPSTGTGNINPDASDSMIYCDGFFGFFELLFDAIGRFIKMIGA